MQSYGLDWVTLCTTTAILGISAFYHDSAAALVVDGEVLCAAQEEQFTRKKHDHAFPKRAVEFCLEFAGLTAAGLDYVGFYDKPVSKFERLIETYLAFSPAGYRSFRQALLDERHTDIYWNGIVHD